jgi:hypothetical protein
MIRPTRPVGATVKEFEAGDTSMLDEEERGQLLHLLQEELNA